MVRAPRRGLIDGDREFGIPDFDRFPACPAEMPPRGSNRPCSAACFAPPFD